VASLFLAMWLGTLFARQSAMSSVPLLNRYRIWPSIGLRKSPLRVSITIKGAPLRLVGNSVSGFYDESGNRRHAFGSREEWTAERGIGQADSLVAFGTRLRKNRAPLEDIKALMGHDLTSSKDRITLRYVHGDLEMLREAVETLVPKRSSSGRPQQPRAAPPQKPPQTIFRGFLRFNMRRRRSEMVLFRVV